MSLLSYLLLAATASCCFTTLFAFPMEGLGTHRNCQCVTTSTALIPSRMFQRIEILPPGAHCRKTEILITKKDNRVVCIDPKAPWINKIITRVMSKESE